MNAVPRRCMIVIEMSDSGSELPIAVHYNKVFAGIMLGSALFILFVAFGIGRLFPQALTGGLLLLMSIAFLIQPIFVVTAGEIQMRNVLGMTLKRHGFETLRDLSIRDGKLWVKDKAVSRDGWYLSGPDWRRLERTLDAARRDAGANDVEQH